MKKLLYCTLSLLTVLICACGDGNVRGHRPDANANYVIDTEIKPMYVCCNNSCYVQNTWGDEMKKFTEYSGGNARIEVTPTTITEADKLNGVEWAARFTVFGGNAYRDYNAYSKKWDSWGETMPPASNGIEMIDFFAEKKNGKWSYKIIRDGVKGITCADIPK